ncbi:hypothetical protein DID76_03310 [Candidatus Marinamargulisbacteria bacterium SCGC AG-414-C22]|nr:hypothetical protein DID76_03310 [Candidatus Marinamargulisbacteria bacterium SCGC AG-414-C22]
MKLKTLFGLILLVVSVSFAFNSQPISIKSQHQLFMGGTAVSNTFNELALIHNPAALGLNKQAVHILRINTNYSEDTTEVISEFREMKDLTESAQLGRLSLLVPKEVNSRLTATPLASYSNNSFAVGLFTDQFLQASLKRKTNPTFAVSYLGDVVFSTGFAKQVKSLNNGYLGVSFHYINRLKLYDQTTGSERVILKSDEILNMLNESDDSRDLDLVTYSGFDATVGYLKPFTWGADNNAHFGITAKNIFGHLSGTKTVNNVDRTEGVTVPMVVTTGISSTVPYTQLFNFIGKPIVSADFNIVSPDSDIVDNLYLGIEQPLFGDLITMRGGLNQGYVVGGTSLKLKFNSLKLCEIAAGYSVDKHGEGSQYNAYKYTTVYVNVLF